jgi:hypothetical protein
MLNGGRDCAYSEYTKFNENEKYLGEGCRISGRYKKPTA